MWCGDWALDDCFAPVSAYARRAEELKAEILAERGVDVKHVILTSDEKRFGGFDNVRPGGEYLTTPMEWNGRKNWLQVCGLADVLGV